MILNQHNKHTTRNNTIHVGIIIIIFVVININSFAQGTWESGNVPVSQNLNDLCFIDSITGWIVGDSGTILHTGDGGHSWSIQTSNTENNILSVFFTDKNHGWAAAHNFSSVPYGTELLSTKDGGQSWIVSQYNEHNIFITSIFYHDTITGWMGGTPHALLKTEDGGSTWIQAIIDTSALAFFPVLNLTFYDTIHGFASGGLFDIAGVIWITDNGGETWSAIDPDYAPADEVHGLYIFNSERIIGSGGDPDFGFGVGFTNTINGGISWTYDEIGVLGIAYDIDFVNESEGWAPLGPEQNLIYTLDTGNTWNVIPTPQEYEIFDIQFTDNNHGYGVGRYGSFIKYKPGPVGIIENKIPFDIKVFPNPASTTESVEIRFEHDSLGKYTIQIYGISGNLIMTDQRVNSILNSGIYKINAGELHSGSYLVIIKSEMGNTVMSSPLVIN